MRHDRPIVAAVIGHALLHGMRETAEHMVHAR
jgi:hypothetical protein